MVFVTPKTYVVGELATSSDRNIYERDNISELKARLLTASAIVDALESFTSTSYVDPATVGPAVTLVTGTEAEISLSSWLDNSVATNQTWAGVAVSGATVRAAGDTDAIAYQAFANLAFGKIGHAFLMTSLTPGTNTFTMRFRVDGGTGRRRWSKLKVTALKTG